AKLGQAGVDAVVLPATGGTSTRCGAVITRELGRAGLPTVQVSTMTPVAVMVGANRIVSAAGIIHPLGSADLSPEEEKALRRRIVEQALQALRTEVAKPTVFTRE